MTIVGERAGRPCIIYGDGDSLGCATCHRVSYDGALPGCPDDDAPKKSPNRPCDITLDIFGRHTFCHVCRRFGDGLKRPDRPDDRPPPPAHDDAPEESPMQHRAISFVALAVIAIMFLFSLWFIVYGARPTPRTVDTLPLPPNAHGLFQPQDRFYTPMPRPIPPAPPFAPGAK